MKTKYVIITILLCFSAFLIAFTIRSNVIQQNKIELKKEKINKTNLTLYDSNTN